MDSDDDVAVCRAEITRLAMELGLAASAQQRAEAALTRLIRILLHEVEASEAVLEVRIKAPEPAETFDGAWKAVHAMRVEFEAALLKWRSRAQKARAPLIAPLIAERDALRAEVERLKGRADITEEASLFLQDVGEAFGTPIGGAISKHAIAERARMLAEIKHLAVERDTALAVVRGRGFGDAIGSALEEERLRHGLSQLAERANWGGCDTERGGHWSGCPSSGDMTAQEFAAALLDGWRCCRCQDHDGPLKPDAIARLRMRAESAEKALADINRSLAKIIAEHE